MNEISKKDHLRATLGTILFHLVLLLLFFFFGLRTPLPLPAEEGVMIALGVGDQGIGAFLQQPSPAQPAAPRPQTPPEDVVTQDLEESIALPPPTTQPRPVPTQEPPRPTTTQQAQPQEPQQRPDPRALFPGTSQASTAQPQGTTGQPGSQGDPTGSPNGAPTGSGQDGISYDLGGRGHLQLGKPEPLPGRFGRVVVEIWVSREGRVTRAVAGVRGTTISDRTLLERSERAAMMSRFTPRSDAPQEQRGTITYNFVVQ